jgi:hypothetical protein
MIPIKKVKQIREDLNLSAIVIYGIDAEGREHVSTHGKMRLEASIAAELGNKLKKILDWPANKCNSKPLERICSHCEYWQRGYHRPGDVILANQDGKCLYEPAKVLRYEKDTACGRFEPSN